MSSAPFQHLQAFLTVARLGNFSSAARELGVSRSAVSQSVRQLESQLGVVLLARTTRSVSLTDAGRRLVESAGPAYGQVLTAFSEIQAEPGEVVGRVRLSVPRAALPFVIDPVLPVFRARHRRVHVDLSVEDRFVDIVAEGYDAGVRLGEALERDMVQVRLTDPIRFVVVGAPEYFAEHGTPENPEDLLAHDCITFRSPSTGALYAWELEDDSKEWRLPVRGGVETNDALVCARLAERGLGLAYAPEPLVGEAVRAGRLQLALEAYAPTGPGFSLYYPSRAQRSAALAAFVETAKAHARRTL